MANSPHYIQIKNVISFLQYDFVQRESGFVEDFDLIIYGDVILSTKYVNFPLVFNTKTLIYIIS